MWQTIKNKRLWEDIVNRRLADKIEFRQKWVDELKALEPNKSLEELKGTKYFFDVSAIELCDAEIRDLRKKYEMVG
ncbi:MAG: hypothetical protein J6M62_11240 [Selenomonadaceae bacterium]|nr:hypothetical protein [Selenomonadaceae bacterium]MBO6305628.1 hypothetical protein [Selenomonadaceae bacterium]